MSAREPRASVIVKSSRAGRVLSGYPWIAREDVKQVVGKHEAGEIVAVTTEDGRSLGTATYNPEARFALRFLDRAVRGIDREWFVERLLAARGRRRFSDTNSWRVLFAEADGVPGLIVDRFDGWLVVQVRSLGMEKMKDLWLPALISCEAPKGILERSDMEGRQEEGMGDRVEVLYGEVPERIEVVEGGISYICPTRGGLKTGFYVDQRDCRLKLRSLVGPGDSVLDVCCYTGGFALNAARAGAEATGIDILPEAVELARENAALNSLNANFVEANAFEWLETADGMYDTILLDPPAIAKTSAERDALKSAVYKLSHLAIPRLRAGGRLVVFSCSYQLGVEALLETVRGAANSHGRLLYVDEVTLQPTDHPYLAQFPESLYLKGVWCRL